GIPVQAPGFRGASAGDDGALVRRDRAPARAADLARSGGDVPAVQRDERPVGAEVFRGRLNGYCSALTGDQPEVVVRGEQREHALAGPPIAELEMREERDLGRGVRQRDVKEDLAAGVVARKINVDGDQWE